jgi:hypothetical protein
MSNEMIHARLEQQLNTLGMTPSAARHRASLAFQLGQVHEWPDGQISCQLDGRIDSTPYALQNFAARIVAGVPSAERQSGLSYEEQRELKATKIQRDGSEYSF